MKDKSVGGMKKELHDGLIQIGVFMQNSMGFPHEMFIDKVESMSLIEQLVFYLSFRNKYPKIFKNK